MSGGGATMAGPEAGAADPQALLAVLKDGERPEAERVDAARALGACGTIAEIQPMLAVLERSEVGLGLAVVEALRALNAGALLARELKLGADAHRERAAMGLLRLADPRTLDALVEAAAGDAAARVRDQACQALLRLGSVHADTRPRVVEALARALGDESADVRCIAAEGLGKLADAASAATPLRTARASEEDPLARDYIERALARLG